MCIRYLLSRTHCKAMNVGPARRAMKIEWMVLLMAGKQCGVTYWLPKGASRYLFILKYKLERWMRYSETLWYGWKYSSETEVNTFAYWLKTNLLKILSAWSSYFCSLLCTKSSKNKVELKFYVVVVWSGFFLTINCRRRPENFRLRSWQIILWILFYRFWCFNVESSKLLNILTCDLIIPSIHFLVPIEFYRRPDDYFNSFLQIIFFIKK